MSEADKSDWAARSQALTADWIVAARDGVDAQGPEAQALAARHIDWLSGITGTPGAGGMPDACYLRSLAEMYVADERFAATYGGVESAAFVREALVTYAERII
jgi:hypothetical protein